MTPARALPRLFQRAVASFHPDSMPTMVRPNYRRELGATGLVSVCRATVDGGVIGVVVRTMYDGVVPDATLNMLVGVLVAAIAFGNILSFAWAGLSNGRNKIRFISGVLTLMSVLVGSLALAPRTPAGLGMLVAIVVAVWICWSGFVTLRTTVWRVNYSRPVRARITGKLATIQVLVGATMGLTLGRLMDMDERSLRFLAPAAALMGLAGALLYARVRIRGNRALMRDEVQHNGAASLNPVGVVRLLAGDRAFALFMLCQSLMGLGNLMVMPLLPIVLHQEFGVGYTAGILATTAIAQGVMPLAIPLWARVLDRMHVIRFRAIHTWVFVVSLSTILIAVRTHHLWLLYVAAAIKGIGFAGGVLAWNLGHHDFAPAHKASQYMGVHVTLTGVRGLAAPFLAVAIYNALDSAEPGAGSWTFAICLGLVIVGALGFVWMALSMRRAAMHKGEEIEATPPSRAGL